MVVVACPALIFSDVEKNCKHSGRLLCNCINEDQVRFKRRVIAVKSVFRRRMEVHLQRQVNVLLAVYFRV